MSINRAMDKEDVVHTDTGLLHSHKKNEIMPYAATWMDLEIVICDIKYMQNLKKAANEFIYKTEIELQMQKTNMVTRV